MPDVTIGFDEMETGDLPAVCTCCGTRQRVELTERRFVWAPLFAPPLRTVMTKRLSGGSPLFQEHSGYQLFAYRRSLCGFLTVQIGAHNSTLRGGLELPSFRDNNDKI